MSPSLAAFSPLMRSSSFAASRLARLSPMLSATTQSSAFNHSRFTSSARNLSMSPDGPGKDHVHTAECGGALDPKKFEEVVRLSFGNSDPELSDILTNNEKWVRETNEKDPDFFAKIGAGQSPRYLYIGCSDARVDPTIMMGLNYGELFIHRNVGNVVCGSDLNFLTVLEFAMSRLQVPHIIVCGHYDCGAVRGSSKQEDHGVIENWLRNIRDVQRIHHTELAAIKDNEERHRRLVELNVIEQCINILKTGCVQRRRAESLRGEGASPYALPRVHALVFDPAVGLLKKLPVDWNEATSPFSEVYDLYPQDTPKVWGEGKDTK